MKSAGVDLLPLMTAALDIMRPYPNQELIWASPRELLNVFHTDTIGCHIITVTCERVCDTEVEYAGKAQESREILAYQYARLPRPPRWQREHDNRQLQTKLPTCVCLSVLIRVHLWPIFVL